MTGTTTAGITGVDVQKDLVLVTWPEGHVSTFHHVWLRDNCPCSDCQHESVPERLLDSLSVPMDIAPASAGVGPDGELVVVWPDDGHRSTYDPRWLADHAYDAGPRPSADVGRVLWTAGPPDPVPEVTYDEVMSTDDGLRRWLEQLLRHGVCFVRSAPTVPGTVSAIAERVGFLRNSNFGLLWDVQSKPDPDSVAYTSHALAPHVDLVSREMLPGVQLLHCLVFEATGGDTMMVDGFACAAELAASDPEAYELLTTTPLPFRYRDGGATDLSMHVPMIHLDHDGAVHEVRYSNGLLAPLDVPPDQTLAVYRAIRSFVSLLRSGRFELQLRLQPGDVMCFDNYRMLHGRTEFDPQSGRRHLQGCYLDRDDVLSRLRTLPRPER